MKSSKICLYDIVCFYCILVTLAFHDNRVLFIPGQLLFILLTMLNMFQKNKIRFPKKTLKYIIWYAVFILFCAMSSLWALNRISIRSILVSIIQVSLIGICIINYIKEEKDLKRVVNSIIFASIALCFRLIVSVPFAAWGTERVGFYIGYGNVGVTYVLAYVSVIAFYIAKRDTKRSYYLLSLLFIFMSCMTGTKKGIIAFVLGVFIILLLESKNIKLMLKNIMIFVVICIIGYLSIMNIKPLYNSIGTRIESSIGQIRGETLDKSTRDRAILMKTAWNTFKKYPILGIGIDGFKNYETNTIKVYAHNNYLELMADIGILGTMIYYSVLIYTLVILIVHKRELNSYCVLAIALLTTLLVGDLSSVSYCNESLQIYLSTTFGIACFSQRYCKSLKNENGDLYEKQ